MTVSPSACRLIAQARWTAVMARRRIRATSGDGWAGGQAGDPVGAVAAQPTIRRRSRDRPRLRGGAHGPALLHDAGDEDIAPIRVQAPCAAGGQAVAPPRASEPPGVRRHTERPERTRQRSLVARAARPAGPPKGREKSVPVETV